MGWFRPKSSATVTPTYTGLQLQTSVNTLPVPIVWGATKVSANIVWYDNFQTQEGDSGGKGGYFNANDSTSYSADLIMGLCEGPIAGVNQIWKDQSVYDLSELGLLLFGGATPQPVWSYLETNYPYEALAYQGTAYVCAPSYALGSNAEISNHNFEVEGILFETGGNFIDADPSQVISDFLVNAQYGVGFDGGSIDATTLFGSGGDASLQTYCKAAGIAFSPALTDQEQASSILARWLQICNCAAVWSGGQLKFIPYGDQTIAAGTQTTVTTEIALLSPSTTAPPPTIVMCSAYQFVADGGVVYANSLAPLTYIGASVPEDAGSYGISPPGTYLFATDDEGAGVAITYTYQVLTSYAPDLTPVYSLADNDFVDSRQNEDPVLVSRVDPFSLPTIQRIEVMDRNNQYGLAPVEARDQSQIELYGPRVGSTITAHEICDVSIVASVVAQTILQRELYIRAHFTFKLSWLYCLLDPMDIVEITDANLGLSRYAVRITAIEEDDKGVLTVTAEELTVGVSTPALYRTKKSTSAIPNQGAAADPVNPPLIYEPPAALTGGTNQIWIGASGGSAGAFDPNWGGAYVWGSLDDATYSQLGTITGAVKQGFLTAALPADTGYDTVDTLAVNLAESNGKLASGTQAQALAGVTLCLVDNELIAYATATLTSANNYNLTGLARGLYGTTPVSHAVGASFTRLNQAIVKQDLAAGYIGQTIYFKFQSFNVFGNGVEELSACAAYAYTPAGTGVSDPIAAQLESGLALDLGLVNVAPSLADDFGTAASVALAVIDLGAINPDPIATQLLSGLALDLGLAATAPTVFDDFGLTTGSVASVIDLGLDDAAIDPIAAQILAGGPLDFGSMSVAPTVFDDFGSFNIGVKDEMDLGAD